MAAAANTAAPIAVLGEAKAPQPTPTRRSRRNWSRLLTVSAVLSGAVVLCLAAAALWISWGLPETDFANPPAARTALVLEAADGAPINRNSGSYAGPVTRQELPDHLVKAVLAVQDRQFYDQVGTGPLAVARAAWRNFRGDTGVGGGSTITQQVAATFFRSRERTFRNTVRQAIVATSLELRLSKDEILTRYLDGVYFGAGAAGISAAAKLYFDKPVRDLDLAQSATLAALIRTPSGPKTLPGRIEARDRARSVVQAMADAGFLTRDQAINVALNTAAPIRDPSAAQTGSWFGDWVYADATDAIRPLAGAARIRTTLQPRLQAIAENVVRAALDRNGRGKNVGQAALVAMTKDGAVVAMVGGRSYEDSQSNRAADSLRSPGSAFHPFVYLAAFRSGWRPESTIVDGPVNIDGWRPKNLDGRFHGEVTLEQAFGQSLNAATAQLAQEVGINNVIAAAQSLGIDAKLEARPTLAVGGTELTLLDLTGAFASIAAGRVGVQPWAIAGASATVTSEPSSFERDAGDGQELDHREDLLKLLTAVVRNGTGRAAALDGFAAGATGTSPDDRDAWFVGFTDALVAGVWVGNDDNSTMTEIGGGGLPAEIWRDFMAEALGLTPAANPPEPEPPVVSDVPAAAPPAADTGPTATASVEPAPPAADAPPSAPPPVAAVTPPPAPVPAEVVAAEPAPAPSALPRPDTQELASAPPAEVNEPDSGTPAVPPSAAPASSAPAVTATPPAAKPEPATPPRAAARNRPAARPEQAPPPRAAARPAAPKPPAAKPQPTPPPRVAAKPAAPPPSAARVETATPRNAAPGNARPQLRPGLAERRAQAERYVAERRAAAERRARAAAERRAGAAGSARPDSEPPVLRGRPAAPVTARPAPPVLRGRPAAPVSPPPNGPTILLGGRGLP